MAAEKNFENKVKSFLDSMGAWYIKYWAGAKYTKEGIPDILACINGKFYAIELKAPNGRPKLLQLKKLKDIRMAGGVGILLYPKDFDHFVELIQQSQSGFDWYGSNIDFQNDWLKKF